MAMLVGGRYDAYDHTIMINDGDSTDYGRYIDPDTGEIVFVSAGSSDWDDRRETYIDYRHPPKLEADDADAPPDKE
jgi:hypothetical protein